MASLGFLQRQITTIQDLQSVVKTMKVLSAASIRQYERAVESMAEYTRTIELGLQVVLNEYGQSGEGDLRLLTSSITGSNNPALIRACAGNLMSRSVTTRSLDIPTTTSTSKCENGHSSTINRGKSP